jgi:hypothetical protein
MSSGKILLESMLAKETKRNENGSEESEKEAISKDPIHRRVMDTVCTADPG